MSEALVQLKAVYTSRSGILIAREEKLVHGMNEGSSGERESERAPREKQNNEKEGERGKHTKFHFSFSKCSAQHSPNSTALVANVQGSACECVCVCVVVCASKYD
jgi:hypothetical protein